MHTKAALLLTLLGAAVSLQTAGGFVAPSIVRQPWLLRTSALSALARPLSAGSSGAQCADTERARRLPKMSTASPRALDASVVIEPTDGTHDSTIIFLHGSGDSGEGAREWVQTATGGAFAFPKTKIIFPTAPMRKYSLLGPHGVMRVWFDRQQLDPTGPEDVAGTDAMRQQLRRVIDEEVARGIPLNRIVCGASRRMSRQPAQP